MKVKKIMTADVETCLETDNLAAVCEIMKRGNCKSVPVVDEQNSVIGTITDRDILFAAALEKRCFTRTKVADLINREFIFCTGNEQIEDALKRMRSNKTLLLPVVSKSGKLAGVLSISDVLMKAKKLSKKVLPVLKAVSQPAPIVLTEIEDES